MTDLDPSVRAIADAIQAFVNNGEDPGLVTEAVVLFEVASVDADGDTARRIDYTVPTDNFALSGALGLVEAGRVLIRRGALGRGEDE